MPYLLLIIGLLLIFIEFYLPGAIMGIIGSVMIIASLVVFVSESSSPIYIVLYMIGVAFCIGLLIKFALWRIVHTKEDRSIYSDDAQVGFKASHYDKQAIGKKGVVLSDLKPGGYVLIDGEQHGAISVSGYLPKGTPIIAIGGQEESLIVQSITKEEKL